MIYLNSDNLATLHFHVLSMSIFCLLEKKHISTRDRLVLINSASKEMLQKIYSHTVGLGMVSCASMGPAFWCPSG